MTPLRSRFTAALATILVGGVGLAATLSGTSGTPPRRHADEPFQATPAPHAVPAAFHLPRPGGEAPLTGPSLEYSKLTDRLVRFQYAPLAGSDSMTFCLFVNGGGCTSTHPIKGMNDVGWFFPDPADYPAIFLPPDGTYNLWAWRTVGGVDSDTTKIQFTTGVGDGFFAFDSCYSYFYGGKYYNDMFVHGILDPWRTDSSTTSALPDSTYTHYRILGSDSDDTTTAQILSTTSLNGFSPWLTSSTAIEMRPDLPGMFRYYWLQAEFPYYSMVGALIPLSQFPLEVDEDNRCPALESPPSRLFPPSLLRKR